MASNKRISNVWDYFEVTGDGSSKKTVCSLCSASLAFNGGTSSMKKHLQFKHPSKDISSSGSSRQVGKKLILFVLFIKTIFLLV